MIGNFSFHSDASNIFTIIVNSIPLQFVREYDLTFNFKFKNGSDGIVSIIDYICCLLTPDATINNEIRFFHSFLKTNCRIPIVFIKNAKFNKL